MIGSAKPKITLAILDKFHPHIKAAITAVVPGDWRTIFIEENSLAARVTAVRDADIAIFMAAPIPKDVMAAAQRLRFIQELGDGVDRIDLETCRARLHAGNSIPVTEHTVLLRLAVYRQLLHIDRRTRDRAWDKESARGEHRQLLGKTIGLIGLGAVGRDVAKRLRGFDIVIVYYDPIRPLADVEQSLGVSYAELDDLVRGADIVSLHLLLLPQTAETINAERIRAMKPSAVLINCARGGLVDEAALVKALKDGRLFGADIDVFANEPPVGSELLALENAVITSHLAGATLDNFSGLVTCEVEDAKAVLRGETLSEADVVVAPNRNVPVFRSRRTAIRINSSAGSSAG